MNFTSTPPTTPGFYAWRRLTTHSPICAHVIKSHCELIVQFSDASEGHPDRVGGKWCLLVPAEEVEKARLEALKEALDLSVRGLPPISCRAILNARIDSCAKRVMEGKE